MSKGEVINGVNEVDFKTQFISNFLSSWCANNYDCYLYEGLHDRLGNPPVEDAEDLAIKAWRRIFD